LLRVRDIRAQYGRIVALKGVSLDVPDGQVVGLIGGNGAGKSTLLKVISGLIRPSQGEVLLDSRPLNRMRPFDIVQMGVSQVPEGRRVFPKMTVLENLKMGAFSRSDHQGIKKSLGQVYELFPILYQRQHQRAGTLSGGEQQMLALGRGLMSDPEVLLLDEPSMGLAPMLLSTIAEAIRQINSLGTAVLLVEQKAPIAFKVAGYIYVMETGHIALSGTPAELSQDDRVKRVYLGEA